MLRVEGVEKKAGRIDPSMRALCIDRIERRLDPKLPGQKVAGLTTFAVETGARGGGNANEQGLSPSVSVSGPLCRTDPRPGGKADASRPHDHGFTTLADAIEDFQKGAASKS